MKRNIHPARWLAIALVIAVAACDDDDPMSPGGDAEGDVEAVIVDDPASTAPAIVGPRASAAANRPFTGTTSGDFRVEISTDGVTWVSLGSMNQVNVDLQSSTDETMVHASQEVAAGTYTRARLIFDGASTTIAAGSTIGALALTTDVVLTLAGGGEVTVERTIQLTVSDDSSSRIVFDLNSEAWVTETNVLAGAATETDVSSSIAAGVVIE